LSRSFYASKNTNTLPLGIALALILDIPFLAMFIVIWGEKPDTMALLVLMVPLTISGFLIYISFNAQRMTYKLGEKDLYIDFPASPLRLRYEEVRDAKKVETSLKFRVFGGSWPGAHWGLFTTSNLGNVQVYTTKHVGNFILLELSDSSRVLLSPNETDEFLERIKEKLVNVVPKSEKPKPQRKDYFITLTQVAIITIAWVGLIAYIVYIYPGLPEVIPVHFDLNGIPNRWGNKNELFLLAGVAAIFPLMNAVFAFKFGKFNKGLTTFLSFVFLLTLGLFFYAVNQMVQAV
jgi:hypothetical protein